jgi:Helix-turn-helix domain
MSNPITSAVSSASSFRRATQRDRLLALLRDHHGSWVPLSAILDLQIAQYGTRILELRRAGYQIENKQQGEHSWFRLLSSPGPAPAIPKKPQAAKQQGELFADQPCHKDTG